MVYSEHLFGRENKLILIFVKKKTIYFIYVSTLSLSSDTPEEGNGPHYRWL